jgi:hypothetical protein
MTSQAKVKPNPKGCRLNSGALKACKGLDAVLQMPYQRGTRKQGVELHSMFKTTGKMQFSRHLVVIKSGEHGAKGIIANHCPFCGNEIYQPQAVAA